MGFAWLPPKAPSHAHFPIITTASLRVSPPTILSLLPFSQDVFNVACFQIYHIWPFSSLQDEMRYLFEISWADFESIMSGCGNSSRTRWKANHRVCDFCDAARIFSAYLYGIWAETIRFRLDLHFASYGGLITPDAPKRPTTLDSFFLCEDKVNFFVSRPLFSSCEMKVNLKSRDARLLFRVAIPEEHRLFSFGRKNCVIKTKTRAFGVTETWARTRKTRKETNRRYISWSQSCALLIQRQQSF